MDKEIDIKVSFTPHPWDNAKKPYFWCILKYNTTWYNAGCGWAENPQIAWEEANKYYERFIGIER